MLSIELIRRDPDLVRAALARRGELDSLAGLRDLDARRRAASSRGDELRARRNAVSREIGQLRAAGQDPPAETVAEMRAIGPEIAALEQESKDLAAQIQSQLLELPNLPRPAVPEGCPPRTMSSSGNGGSR